MMPVISYKIKNFKKNGDFHVCVTASSRSKDIMAGLSAHLSYALGNTLNFYAQQKNKTEPPNKKEEQEEGTKTSVLGFHMEEE